MAAGERMTLRTTGGAALAAAALAVAFSGCTVPPPQPRDTSPGHLSTAPQAPPAEIPEPVRQTPYVPPPQATPPAEKYTVVVSNVPAKELLFALARDAAINVDVHPEIEGNITLNAVDQTLSQILDRIARQLPIRYEEHNGTLIVLPDTAFLRTYKVDYVNVTRESGGEIGASTLVASSGSGGGGGLAGNVSSSTISNTSNNRFWEALQTNVEAIVQETGGVASAGAGSGVTVNRESGLLLVRGTSKQHEVVQEYLDKIMASVTRQVLIEATIVEVQLNDRYQAGIDWTVFSEAGGASGLILGSDLGAAFTGGLSSLVTGLLLSYTDDEDPDKQNINATVSLLNEFGDTQVLSSPKVMTLNNQPAVLKVVENLVYFELNVDVQQGDINTQTLTTVDSEVRTVSVGVIMSVTPQISEGGAITLNIRPTITSVQEFVDDPAVPIALANAGPIAAQLDVSNSVPVVQVRETETVMRVGTGQLAVLGGLMQDEFRKDDEDVPGFSSVEGVGELFKFREQQQIKSELVIFLRPTVIRVPDVRRDLASFRRYLPENLEKFEALESPLTPLFEPPPDSR
jgi:general secretion pathway protein D